MNRGWRLPLIGCVLLAAGCGGERGPVLIFYREITAGQLYGLGFEITTVRVERPDRGRVGEPLEVAARLAIEQKGASAAHPVLADRRLELRGSGCDIQLAAGSDTTNWKWLVLPKARGPLRLGLDLSGLPGPLTSCKLDDRYVACESLRQFEMTVPIE
jgi:hypothetical protein